jgi:hypothetical protein
MNTTPAITPYLLIDSALLALAASARPFWLLPVYDDPAASVGPLVIDIQAAWDSNDLDAMMSLLNAAHPQLHASIIETTLSHTALVQHLRRFIMIRTETGKDFTLRFADCLGLPMLAAIFTAEQWGAMAGPMVRWCVHGRDGRLLTLPPADVQQTPAPTPLVLMAPQIAALTEATAPDAAIADIREMRHDLDMPGSGVEQHQWASDARALWRRAGNVDRLVLRWLTAAALDTHGAVLTQTRLPSLLALEDVAAIRAGLDNAARQSAEAMQRASKPANRGVQ